MTWHWPKFGHGADRRKLRELIEHQLLQLSGQVNAVRPNIPVKGLLVPVPSGQPLLFCPASDVPDLLYCRVCRLCLFSERFLALAFTISLLDSS